MLRNDIGLIKQGRITNDLVSEFMYFPQRKPRSSRDVVVPTNHAMQFHVS